MVCTRCGAVQRRATARFCHECGATIEPVPTNVQPDITEIPTSESTPQPAEAPPTVSLILDGPAEQPMLEQQAWPGDLLPQQPASSYIKWQDQAPASLGEQEPVRSDKLSTQEAVPPAVHAPPAFPDGGAAVSSFGNQQPAPVSPATQHQGFEPENAGRPAKPTSRNARLAPPVWPENSPAWERQGPPEPAGAPPGRQAAKGPVPGAFQKPRSVKRQRLPLGVIITLALVLVFVIAGVGIYVFAGGSSSQEPAAFLRYTDPGHHFSITYPTVWTVKQVSGGVRFADATDTAELSVTYTPNTGNLTAEQFADQEATKEGISTPDTQTFAGTTWVERSGIVTQTSGISQDIFLFVAVSNNFLFEIREVAPLDGYKEPNQTAFMPMLRSLVLM